MARPKKEKPNHGKYYEVKVTIGTGLNGKAIRKSFYSEISKEDAKRQGEEYRIAQEVSSQIGLGLVEKSKNFSEWADIWLEKYIKGSVKDNTYVNNYESVVRLHLKPYFGAADLIAIKPIDVKVFFDSKREDGCALESMKKMRVCLNSLFDAAVENDLCYKNPVTKRLSISSDKTSPEKRAYTKEQRDAVIKYAKSHPNGLAIIVMLKTGLSRSELLGLMWRNIDFDNATIQVVQGAVAIKSTKTNRREVLVGEPKNDFRKRIIPIDSELVGLLRTKYNSRTIEVGGNKHKKRAGTIVIPKFVFCNSKGEVFDPDNWRSRVYAPFMKDMLEDLSEDYPGIEALNAHELRHTFATLAKQETDDLFTLAKIMGHADLKMLYDRYAHTSLDDLRKVLKIPEEKQG